MGGYDKQVIKLKWPYSTTNFDFLQYCKYMVSNDKFDKFHAIQLYSNSTYNCHKNHVHSVVQNISQRSTLRNDANSIQY